jgi:hypothetical protein
MATDPDPNQIAIMAQQLSVDGQYALALQLAANCGYKLVPEDSIQDAEDRADLEQRVSRLEAAVHELNPGWMP